MTRTAIAAIGAALLCAGLRPLCPGAAGDAAAPSSVIAAGESVGSPRLWLSPDGTPAAAWRTAPAPRGPDSHFLASQVYGRPLAGPQAQAPAKPLMAVRLGSRKGALLFPQGASFDVAALPTGEVWVAGVRTRFNHWRGHTWIALPFAQPVVYQPEAEAPFRAAEEPALPVRPLEHFHEFVRAHRGTSEVRLLLIPDATPWVVAVTFNEPRSIFLVRSASGRWLTPQVLAEGRHPAPARGARGGYHIFFETERGLSRVSSQDGERWTAPVPVPGAEEGRQPAAASGAGRLWLAWSAGPEASADLRLAESEDDGATWSPPRGLTTGAPADTDPALLVDRENRVWVAFIRPSGETRELRVIHVPAGKP